MKVLIYRVVTYKNNLQFKIFLPKLLKTLKDKFYLRVQIIAIKNRKSKEFKLKMKAITMNLDQQKKVFDDMFPDTENFKERRIHLINKISTNYTIHIQTPEEQKRQKEKYDIYGESKEYASAFIHFLKKYNELSEYTEYHEPVKCTLIKSMKYTRYLSFKKLICELIFHGINSIPHDVTEYTITLKTPVSMTQIIIGILDNYDDDNEISIIKFINKNGEVYPLNKTQVQNLYVANRCTFHDKELVDILLNALYLTDTEPVISTSYITTKKTGKW